MSNLVDKTWQDYLQKVLPVVYDLALLTGCIFFLLWNNVQLLSPLSY